jgi:heme/copper-type cytochrome/quinol oxidase subunit 2
MDNLTRVRQASAQVAKVQRRFWLFQTLFWPAVIGAAGVIAAVAVGSWVRYRRNAAAQTDDVRLSVPSTANPTEARLNGASSGNHYG